ncbi:hypothetical protein GCM10025298_25850 [Natronobiforma cellulositropha]
MANDSREQQVAVLVGRLGERTVYELAERGELPPGYNTPLGEEISVARYRSEGGVDVESARRSLVAQRQRTPAGESTAPDVVREVLSQPGQGLEGEVRETMESRLGYPFDDVRIHTGPRAAAAASALEARAFTVGNHVVFNRGEYDPDSREGTYLLAHELTHVRQQTGGRIDTFSADEEIPVARIPIDVEQYLQSGGDTDAFLQSENEPDDDDPLVYHEKVDEAFTERVREIAAELGADPNHLMAIMAFETGYSFDPAQENMAGSGATGLIQFMPRTAEGLGTSTDELAEMTALEQLEYVRAYFQPYAGNLDTVDDFYMAVLWPAAVGESDDYVLFEEGTIQYEQNAGLDHDGDGVITKADAARSVREALAAGQRALEISE